jgi:Xaa-Pro dipeptidase
MSAMSERPTVQSGRASGDARTLEELYTEHLAALQDAHAAAMEEHGYGALVLHAGVPGRRSIFNDQYWPHRPTPAFAHWVPWVKADAVVLLIPGKRPRLLYCETHDYWYSEPPPESDHFWDSFDEVEAADMDALAREIGQATEGRRTAFIGEVLERASAWRIAGADVNPEGLMASLDRVRTRKTDYERHCMAEASRRAAVGHAAVARAFLDGDEESELDLHLIYLAATAQDDSETPYKNIVALDEKAAVLHHEIYGRERTRARNRSLLIDAGASHLGYNSDVTRTYVKGTGLAADVFGKLIAGVEALQAECCRRIAPGLPYESLHDQAHELLGGLLRELGIASASADELVASGATRIVLPHGLGHSLGLVVHDVGCRLVPPRPENPFLRNTSTIEPGQVFTVEPGCYFIDALLDDLRGRPVAASIDWDLVAELAHFGGVRIEDNIAVLEHGIANLTRDNWPAAP